MVYVRRMRAVRTRGSRALIKGFKFMKKVRLSLLAASAICAVAASAMSMTMVASAADYREVTLTGTNVFYAGVGGAEIAVHRIEGEGGDYNDYTSFIIGRDQTVSYRKNLAYDWYAQNDEGVVENGKFSMTVGFEDITSFESYTIAFQSQQYNVTEDGISENYIVFEPDGANLNMYISETAEIAEGEEASVVLTDYSQIAISFGEYEGGNYNVYVNGAAEGQFVNVRSNYASYVSSGESAATPITFSAAFADDAADDASCEMIMYSLNGQSFEVFDAEADDEGRLSGVVHDDRPPVVCLDNNVNYLTYGEEVDIDYTVIDVIASSPRITVKYYVLTTGQYMDEDFNYNDTSEESDIFLDVTTSSDYKLLRDEYTYVPDGAYDAGGIIETDGYKTYGLVKLCLYVRDTSSSTAQTDYVFIDWYVDDAYKVDIKGDGSPDGGFIRMVEDVRGASYGAGAATLEEYRAGVQAVEQDYQAKIDELYPDGIDASSDPNLYLPEFAGYVTDNLGGYTDLSYRIYYRASTTGSSGSLDYNELSLSVSEADTVYEFTVYVTDAAGNDMYYPDENGELQTLSADDVWDEELYDLLPRFTVKVNYRAATVETPGIQTVGYVGSTYNNASFDITGVTGTYSTAYYLYIFDRDAMYQETGIELSYNDVIAGLRDEDNSLFRNTYKTADGTPAGNTRKYFTMVTNDESFADYEWNATNVTFVPRDPSEFYIVRLELTDTGLSNQKTNSFLVVRASARAADIYGEDNWLENNTAAIVLFSVAGAFFIAFIVLLIVKPKDKGDIDAIALQLGEKGKSGAKRGGRGKGKNK